MPLTRRTFLASASTLALFDRAAARILRSGVAVVGLRTEFLATPLGVENRSPRLSWQLHAGARRVRQKAYRITVASSAEGLASGAADLWDSGRVKSANSLSVPYAGKPLASRERCFWRVQVWDELGIATAPSAIANWEMGLLEVSDWSAQWLAAETEAMRADYETGFDWIQGPDATPDTTSKFRFAFELPWAGEATVWLVANGAFKAWMDGKALTAMVDGKEMPADLPIGRRLCTVATLTAPLNDGKHVFGAEIGVAAVGAKFGFDGAEMAVFMRVAAPDGKVLRFGAKGWKTALSADPEWSDTGFDDRSWAEAMAVTKPRSSLYPKQPAILLRRPFVAPKQVKSARLYVTALGGYQMFLNGRRVCDALLAPESNDFRRHVPYRVHDVTALLVSGDNVLGAMIGDGWYASYSVNLGRYAWGPPPRRLLAQLEMTYADGTRDVVGSGPGWFASIAPVVTSEIYDGEQYDARLEQPGWAAPGFDARGWWPAWAAPVPPAKVVAQIDPPIRRERTLAAKSVTPVGDGAYVVDFGQNFAGWARLKAMGAAGTRIEMRFAEILKQNGEVDQANLRSARATDVYVLRGDPAGEVFEPHFTYHGFRYVQVTGFPGTPSPSDLEGVVVHSDLPFTGTLRIGSPLIAALWHNTVWSQRSNFMGIPTDCPQRDERLGWMGDANVFWDAAAFNMDVAAFTRRFMVAVRDSQADSGAYSDFSPATFRFPSSDGSKSGAAPGWADAGVCLPWTVWRRYGDTGIIDENWQAMSRYIRFVLDNNPDFVWRHARGADFGDWLALDAKNPGDPTTPKDLIGTATWAHSVACMAEMAEATGRRDEALRYRALWRNIAAAFVANFVAADATVGNGSQTGYILALRYGLLPQALRSAAAAKLVADIRRRGTLLSTGFLGTPNSLDVLADAGYGSVVYDLLLRTEYPSWGYMVAKGATTIWERWNGDTGDVAMNSFNHYALGAVCGFIFRRIAGIAPLEPGFSRIAIRPVVDPRVKHAGADYDSAMGRISTDWNLTGSGKLNLRVTIPANATALVHLPAAPHAPIRAGRRDARHVKRTRNEAILEIGSGSHEFVVG